MYWYLKVLRHYAVFKGRARRKEYWMFALFNIIFLIVATILDNIAGTTIGELPYGLFYCLYALAVLIPGLAVSIRRLHDVGKSGWMILISLVPLVGAIWLLVLFVTDSEPGENKYGPNPKDSQPEQYVSAGNEGDTIILIAVIWMVFSRLFWTLMPKIFENLFSYPWFNTVNFFMSLIWACIPLGLAFAVKNKPKQMVLFILGGIYLIYNLITLIMPFIR